MAFLMDGVLSTVSRLQALQGDSYFLPLCNQEVLVLIWSTLEGWKAELTLEPPKSFEPGNPGLEIQHPKH